MEILILCCCLMAALGCLTVAAAAALVIWKTWFSASAKKEEQVRLEITEAEKNKARAEEAYAQGFVNMMNYDGSPRKREEREQL